MEEMLKIVKSSRSITKVNGALITHFELKD